MNRFVARRSALKASRAGVVGASVFLAMHLHKPWNKCFVNAAMI
jgi:hypothetical protein